MESRARTNKKTRLKKVWKMSVEDFESLLKSQGNRCAVCGDIESRRGKWLTRNLNVDHCHDTGAVRGLLCNRCNLGLGYFKDDPILLLNAIKYLTKEEYCAISNKETENADCD